MLGIHTLEKRHVQKTYCLLLYTVVWIKISLPLLILCVNSRKYWSGFFRIYLSKNIHSWPHLKVCPTFVQQLDKHWLHVQQEPTEINGFYISFCLFICHGDGTIAHLGSVLLLKVSISSKGDSDCYQNWSWPDSK